MSNIRQVLVSFSSGYFTVSLKVLAEFFFQMILYYQTDFRLVTNQSENGK